MEGLLSQRTRHSAPALPVSSPSARCTLLLYSLEGLRVVRQLGAVQRALGELEQRRGEVQRRARGHEGPSEHARLKALNLSQSNLQAHDAVIIAGLLECNGTLRSLDLSMNNIGGWNFRHGLESRGDTSGVHALGAMLHVNEALRVLNR